MGTISMPQGRGNRQHNLRIYGEGKMPKNIDITRTVENIVWRDETAACAYHRIFDDAVKEYNSKQKRNDRIVKDYRVHILNSKNGEKEFYEDVLQWGKQEDFKDNPDLREVAKECLLEFIKNFDKRNPGLELIGAYIHMDEASPHMHFDYIPVSEGYKTGIQKRNSLDRAMRNLIHIRTGHEYSPRPAEKDLNGKCTDNATKQWKELERAHFRRICIRHGLTVDEETKTPERDSLSVLEYKAEMQKQNIAVLTAKETELNNSVNTLQCLIKQAQEKLESIKLEAVNKLEEAQSAVSDLWERINIRLGLIPKKEIYEAKEKATEYYRKCVKYVTPEMKEAIANEDMDTLHSLISPLCVRNPDDTVKEWKPGYRELADFSYSYEEYLKKKQKNTTTEEILKELELSEAPHIHRKIR